MQPSMQGQASPVRLRLSSLHPHLHQHVRAAASRLRVEEEAVGGSGALARRRKVGHVGLSDVSREVLQGGADTGLVIVQRCKCSQECCAAA